MASTRTTDRRVERTRGLLHDALASLIHEKAYDAIVVKEILARANVGRSTFYAHFRDKDELLDSGIRQMVDSERAPVPVGNVAERLVRFSLPLLRHIERHKGPGSFAPRGGQSAVHDHLERILAELVVDDLRRSGARLAGGVPADLVAAHVAATFVLTLEWWIGTGGVDAASTIDARFRGLVIPTLESLLRSERVGPGGGSP